MKQKKIISSFLQKLFRYKLLKLSIPAIIFLAFLSSGNSYAQIVRKSKIEFYSTDSLLITADHYYSRKENPYILLFHTEQSSRGEFGVIAERFIKMQYNCIAVDIRTGNKHGFVKNETSGRALDNGIDRELEDGEKDIIASLNYVRSISDNNIIILGSSSSASLSLKIAAEEEDITAVIALSPGEFFQPEFEVRSIFENYKIPVFIAGNKSEEPYLVDIFSDLKEEYKTMITASENTRGRGTGLLLEENPANNEYWFSILIFIKSLKEK